MGHVVKDCRKLKYNNEQKLKYGEGPSKNHEIKTIGEIKENNIFVINNTEQTGWVDKNNIVIHSDALNKEQNTFLIDTGADLNIIKLLVVKNYIPIKICSILLSGINETPISTLGTIEINLKINDQAYETQFHVVRDNFLSNMSGILGIPFLKNYDVTLNIKQGKMTINSMENKEINIIHIPPRSNNIFSISVGTELTNNTLIVEKKKLTNKLWIGNTLTNCINNTIHTNVINLSENVIKINKLNINDIEYEIYNEIEDKNLETVKTEEPTHSIKYFEKGEGQIETIHFTERNKVIANELRSDHLNREELKCLSELCYEYSDIFLLRVTK